MELKHYSRDNCVAVWSNSKNHGELLACASENPDNNNLTDLEILSVDLADPAKNLLVEGKSTYNVPYRCLAWGTFGEKEGKLPYGLIFGGMENGSFTLWNPAQMIGKLNDVEQNYIDDQNSFVYAEEAEQNGYPILCAEWNPQKNNYLAYGSTSLFMIDVGKELAPPELLKPSATNPHEGSYITSVAWNKSVSHILASAGSDGLIALYDIKSKKSIFNFRDNSSNNNTRQVEIAWSKQISTHIAVAFDDDKKNEIQIWDLRSQKGPIVVLDKGHTKGVNAMDWSELDHDLILTASRDNRINCWSYKQDQQPLSTRKVDGQIVKVAWAKNLPSIYSVITTEGVSICSLDDRNIHSYIPKWLKTPASSTFNGNQSILTYSEDRGANLIQYIVKPHVPKQLAQRIAVLEEFLQHDNVQHLKDNDGETGQFWKLISTKKNQEGDADIYEFLGLSKQKIVKEVQKYTGKKRETFATNDLKSSKKQKTKTSKLDYTPVPESEAAQIFGKMSFEPMDKSFTKNQDDLQTENVKYDMVPRNFNWDIGKEKLIKQNLLIGNYEGAIDAALKCGRTAEALIIAYSIDQTTFNNTLKTFCTETTDRFISGILRHIAFKDTEELVNRYDLDKWKECVALIFSLSSSDKRKALLSKLARRLSSESKDHEEAVIFCYILAEEFDEIVEMYSNKISKEKTHSRARKVQLVESTTRLMAIYSCLTVDIKISSNFERLLKELALVCLEANKKLLSYQILTKYAPSSTKIINYLIQNTNQLSSYRNQGSVIVNLPVMNKRQEKQGAKKGSKNVEYQEEVPTNIKPNRQPKLPKNNAFDDKQPDETRVAKGRGPVPPPPPPIQPSQGPKPSPSVTQPSNKSTTLAPPPPPPSYSKKGQPFQEAQQERESKPQPISHPGFPKKGGVVPPPPPPAPKNVNKAANTSYEEEPSHQGRGPMPVKQSVQPQHQGSRVPPPPPPPSIHHTHQAPREEPNPVTRPPPTANRHMPPPPPPSRHVAQKQEEQEEPPKKQTAQRTNKVPQRNNQPPPPMPKQINRREEEPEDEDESDEEINQLHVQQKVLNKPASQQVVNRPPPPPAPVKKTGTVPPPPPGKVNRLGSQESQNEEQQQSNTSFQGQARRPVPPPTAGKRVPPPPPPRK